MTITPTLACNVRGHDHDLDVVATHVQRGTGAKASTYECPTGNYRWFVPEGGGLSPYTRSIRPRWGWKT